MGRATEGAFALMGVSCLRADAPADVLPTVEAAATMAYDAGQAVAVLLGQRLIGAKVFTR
jgi:sulfopyruvate decarboxylase TPP-binding subunit